MEKRPDWKAGARLDMRSVCQERAIDVRGSELNCGHFLPEELPLEATIEVLEFLSK